MLKPLTTEQLIMCDRHANGESFVTIAKDFGLTRQRIEQIWKKGRKLAPTFYNTPYKAPKPIKWPIKEFSYAMRKLLWEAGWKKCSTCQLWNCKDNMTSGRSVCLPCGAAEHRKYYQTRPEYRERLGRHNKSEHGKAYHRLWERRRARRNKLLASLVEESWETRNTIITIH